MRQALAAVAFGSLLPPACGTLPLWVKIAHTLFVAALVPVYWRRYGPGNFLWFSDLALFGTLVALWLESPLLVSMQAVSVSLLELVWLADFVTRLLGGGFPVGLSRYMFDPHIPLPVRGLSLFHVVLPVELLWLVARLGYDRRALLAQTLFAWVVLPACYFLTDPAENVNWVFGWGGRKQRWLPAPVYLLGVMVAFPVVIYLPTHLLLETLFAKE